MYLWELKKTQATAVILEVSFHDNLEEAKWIHHNKQIIADVITGGIFKGLHIA
jgi:N-acetylmuramoyl-L-alanine amidase